MSIRRLHELPIICSSESDRLQETIMKNIYELSLPIKNTIDSTLSSTHEARLLTTTVGEKK